MRARSFTPAYADHAQPLAAMNMTPLIDVLLVLLVMMILTIPMMTHKVPIDLPQPGPPPSGQRIVHRIDLGADGRLAWDGAAIADAALPGKLAAMKLEPTADLQVAANAEARYDRFDQMLATIKRAGITRPGFIGNEGFAKFDAR